MNRPVGCWLALAALAAQPACLDGRALVPPTVDEDPSLSRVEVNGTVLHVTELGTPGDPLVVFVHGGPGADHRAFLVWAPLADAGYHLVMYDQRGTGLSRREAKATLDVEHALADLGAIVDHYRVADEPVVLFSHSWGSSLATAFIDADPARVAGAVLTEPPGFTRAELTDFFDRVLAGVTLDEGTSDVLWSATFLSPDAHAHWDYLLAEAALDGEGRDGNDLGQPTPFWRWGAALSYWLPQQIGEFDWTTHLDQVTYPVLWFHSSDNRVTTPEQQRALAQHYPLVEQHLVEGAGHDLLYVRQAELEPVVEDYLARVTGKVGP